MLSRAVFVSFECENKWCVMYHASSCINQEQAPRICINNREHLTIVGLNPNPPPICIIFCASSVAAHPGKDNQTTRQCKTINKHH